MECMELCAEAIALADAFLNRGFNQSSASDLGVAFLSLKTAMQSAWLNVLINLSSIKDAAFAESCRARGGALLQKSLPQAEDGYKRILELVNG